MNDDMVGWLTVLNPSDRAVSVTVTRPDAACRVQPVEIPPGKTAINMGHGATIQFGDGLVVGLLADLHSLN